MAEKANPLRNVQVKFHRSKPLTKIIVIAAIVLSTAALITLRWAQNNIEAETQHMQQEAAQLTQENQELQDKVNNLGSLDSIADIAQEELDLADPDTTFFEPQWSEDN